MSEFAELLGKTLVAAEVVRDEDGDGVEVVFRTADETFRLYHPQDCCECVYVESVVGDLSDLVGHPILRAEEATSENATPEGVEGGNGSESYTWTFYKLATIRGAVDIRWYGGSNGYYSEAVYFRGGPNEKQA